METIDGVIYEELTGLPYAEFFYRNAPEIIRNKLNKPVILSLDISNFKYFNEMYGFDMGDKLIKRCVDWFCINNPDCVLAQRIYVDHIVILIEAGDMTETELEKRYDFLNRTFSHEINQEYTAARIRIYAGAYFIDDRDEEIKVMIDKAQYARRSIKINYTQTIALFTMDMQAKARTESRVIPMFMSALDDDRIKVYIQPKFSIDNQKLIGAEALSRIEDEDGNIVSPGVYLDILENTGLITKLDYYVITKIIELQKLWMEQGAGLTTISMNLSRKDFWEKGFIERIDAQIKESGVPEKYFEFELTETAFCDNFQEIVRQLDFLRAQGYRISMDDFGSGYNSLYMLGKVPIDIIKFDRGFVLNSITVEAGRKIMKNLVSTFYDVNFDVICEGVESVEEEQIVYECGCNAVQGYLHDKPLPSSVFADKYLKMGLT